MLITGNQKFDEIEQHLRRNGRQCGICGEWKMNLSFHVTTQHSGLTHAVISNGEATRDRSRVVMQRGKQWLNESYPLDVLNLVRQMRRSYPARIRHCGGLCTKGPLQGREVAGMPSFFTKSAGRLKRRYKDLVEGPKGPRKARMAPRRACNISTPQPFQNRSWSRGACLRVSTRITTNVWTPAKYPGWTGPPGFLPDRDPTWIPEQLAQCCLCSKSICDCIINKVRCEIPHVRDAPGMGQGARATVGYERGELLGELVGELAPIDHYNDGWAADLFRDDLSKDRKEVRWCQVYPRYMGNWVRKVNHSCESNCIFKSMNISGRWRVMLQATQPIERGSWILVNYGEDYWKDGDRCLCGSRYCISNSA